MTSLGKVRAGSRAKASLNARQSLGISVHPACKYNLICYDKNGNIKWIEDIHNIVVNDGLDHFLSIITTTAHVTQWSVGVGTTSFAIAAGDSATDLAAAEVSTAFSNADLPGFVAGAISAQSVDNSASPAAFNINATTTLSGAYMVNASGKTAPTTGVLLLGGATFSAARAVQSGDTLNVTITISTEVT